MSPMQRSLYPPNWVEISYFIRNIRARGHCEGSPANPDCTARADHAHPVTGSYVVLTTAHLDHNHANCDFANLRALYQRCHLNHDRDQHTATARINRRLRQVAAGQQELSL